MKFTISKELSICNFPWKGAEGSILCSLGAKTGWIFFAINGIKTAQSKHSSSISKICVF